MRKLPLLLLFFASFCFGQSITKFNSRRSDQKLNNVHFALPKTLVQVSIEADKTTIKEPEDNEKLTNILTQDGFDIMPKKLSNDIKVKIDKVTVKTIAKPDENHIYKISTDKKFNRRNTIGLSVSNSGLITGASIESTDLTLRFITSVLVLAAAIPVKAETLKTKTFDPELHIDILFEQLQPKHFLKNIGNANGKKLKELVNEKKELRDSLKNYDTILKKLENDIIFRNYYPTGLDKTFGKENSFLEC